MLYCSYTEWEEYSIPEKKKLSNNSSLKYCSPYRHSLRSKRFQLSLARKLEREPKKIGIVLLSSQLSRWTCMETLATQTTIGNFLITPKNMGLHEYSFIHIKELSWQKRTDKLWDLQNISIFLYFAGKHIVLSQLSLPLDSSACRRAKINNTLKYLIQNSLSSGLTASFSTIEMISIVLTHQRHHHPWLKLL